MPADDQVVVSLVDPSGIENGAVSRHQRCYSDDSACCNSKNEDVERTVSGGFFSTCIKTVRTHKFWMGFTASTWGFLSSVERAVILPTLWLYLTKYWSPESASSYYGVIVAAFSLSILLTTPLYGFAAQWGIRVRTLLLLANAFEIGGNLLYLFAGSPLAVLFARLICGLGASCEPPLYADIARATNADERTSYIVAFLLSRQVGLIFGPAFTLMMDNMNVNISDLVVTVYNGPGLLMAGFWLLHSILILIVYPIVDSSGRLLNIENRSSCCGACDKRTWIAVESHKVEDRIPILNQDVLETTVVRPPVSCTVYMQYSLISIYVTTFASYFCFMGLEAALPPVANRIFGWSEIQTSYVYLAAGVLIIAAIVLLRILNSFCSDRTLLLAGLFVMVISYLWLTIVVFFIFDMPQPVAIVLLLIGIAIHVIGLPFAFAFSESLYTKLAPLADMDRAQSILRTVINVAFLIGPYMGGTLLDQPGYVFLSMTIISFIPLLMVAFRFDAFDVAERSTSPVVFEGDKEC